ncbi:MAG TPA: creatininase family protein [Candidatus Limnocylindrales bacterium]|nr:creatininase family protein [Candidatus Limnocylindrales bacterium]
MTTSEVRLERLRPAGIEAALARAPIAWVPLGALEFHAPHLPNGTDGFTGHGVVARAAASVGGVVLPWSYVTMGTLALPWSFRYDPSTVADVLRQTLRQLPQHGVRLAVVHTGHAPLDLIHLIKRVCAEVEAEHPGLRAYGLCYLELNAALGTGLGTDWPVAVDHGATMETSWLAAVEPGLVDATALPDDPDAVTAGVYGPNPRFTADAAAGGAQIDAAAALLATRASALLAGETLDTFADLRALVERYWPEPLTLGARAGDRGDAALLVTNSGPVSRYLSSIRLRIDGAEVPAADVALRNPTPGELGVAVPGDRLDAEHGFYVRRNQTAEITIPTVLAPGPHEVELALGLAGVAETVLAGSVEAA